MIPTLTMILSGISIDESLEESAKDIIKNALMTNINIPKTLGKSKGGLAAVASDTI